MKFAYSLLATTIFFLKASFVFSGPSLTIYNQNFAVVHDGLTLKLQEGINDVTFTDITAHLEPNSVILRDRSGRFHLAILEQNYRADPVSQELLLSLFEGQHIDFLYRTQEADQVVTGKIIRSGYVPHQTGLRQYDREYRERQMAYARGSMGQPIIEVEGRLRFSLPGIPLFPSLTNDAILKPTLHWKIESENNGKIDAEICYVTGGLSWEADYNLVAYKNKDVLDMIGWITMDNQSAKNFVEANIKLMAGDVSKIQPPDEYRRYAADMASGSRVSVRPSVSEKAFDEYHLYTLNRPTTLRDRETKQVEFVRAADLNATRFYVYDGAMIDGDRYRGYSLESIRQDRDYGTKCNYKVWVMREFQNSETNRLGLPLPRGRVRFYQRDDDGRLEFTGENVIDHTPKDELVRVYTGNAFDLRGERRRVDYQIDTAHNWIDESFEIKLRNHKKEAVVIRVVEHLYRWINWEITNKSNTYLKTDSQTIEFRVQVEPDAENIIAYRVHYTW